MKGLLISVAVVVAGCTQTEHHVAPVPDRSGVRIVAAWYRQPDHGAVTEDGVSVIDLDSGSVTDRSLPEYGAGDAQFKLVRVGDALVFRGHRDPDYGAFAIDAHMQGSPRFLGKSWYFVPSAHPGRIWLTYLDRRPRQSGQTLSGVREVDMTGRATQRPTHVSPDEWLVGAVTSGLVFQAERKLLVWDPRTGDVVVRLPGAFPVAQHDDVLASCSPDCSPLRISRVGQGTATAVQQGGELEFEETYDGTFSPRGEWLATPVQQRGRTERLALIDVHAAIVHAVVPARVDESFPVSAWSATGEWVFFNSGDGQITGYELASGELRTFELGADHVVVALARGA